MRSAVLAILLGLVGACGDNTPAAPDARTAPIDARPPAPDAMPSPDAGAQYGTIYSGIDGAHLVATLHALADLGERFDAAGRQRFRDYWTAQMTGLGLTVRELDYDRPETGRSGVDLEAVLPGASPDSIVVIVHYDSIGPFGAETSNPGVDDDMSGMAIELETARVLAAHAGHLARTVRFVASDQEETGGLAGARAYAQRIQSEAAAGGFRLIAAVDDEQTGWNCMTDASGDQCGGVAAWPTYDVFSCGDQFDFPSIGDQLEQATGQFAPDLHVERGCIGANSDHYAMWEIGVPAVVFTEHNPFANPHFDQNGGDTFDKIDTAYFTAIAKVAIVFQAELVGVSP